MNPSQLRIRRKILATYISRDSTEIVIRRRDKVSTPGGGYARGTEYSLKPQFVRVAPFKRRFSPIVANTVAGQIPEYALTIVGGPELNVQPGDVFTLDGSEFEIIELDPDRSIRTAAMVSDYGPRSG